MHLSSTALIDDRIESCLGYYSERIEVLLDKLLVLNNLYETGFTKKEALFWLSFKHKDKRIRGKKIISLFNNYLSFYTEKINSNEDIDEEIIDKENFTCVDCKDYQTCTEICSKLRKLLPYLEDQQDSLYKLGWKKPNFYYFDKKTKFYKPVS